MLAGGDGSCHAPPVDVCECKKWILVEAEHQLDVLNGGARRALSEVVEPSQQNGLAQLRLPEHIQL